MTETAVVTPRMRGRNAKPIRVALSALVLGTLGVALALVPGAAFVAFLPALLAGLMGFMGGCASGLRIGGRRPWDSC